MEYKAFKKELKNRLEKLLGPCTKVYFNTIEKNNKSRKETITFQEDGFNMMPAIQLTNLYEDFLKDEDLERTIDFVLKVLETKGKVNTASIIGVWERAKEKIQIKLINCEWNQEMLHDVPYRRFLDLAVIFQIRVHREIGGVATILVDKSIMEKWGVTEKDLFECAYQNLKNEKYLIEGMGQIISRLMGDEVTQKDEDMFVMSNEEGFFGAAGLLRNDLLKEFADKIQGDFYILPSSVHEIIFIKYDPRHCIEELKEMVTEINETTVEDAERLTNNVFLYNREIARIVI